MDALQECLNHAALALRPDPRLTVSEWADANRFLSQTASGEPGPWRTERTPYLKEIMDCLSPGSPVEKVIFMKGAQIGGPLALDTPIPTASGWKTMGGLQAGDVLFDEAGRPCRITGCSEVLIGRQCFEVVFDDGERIVCDGIHRWPVCDFTSDVPVAKTLRTEEMVGHVESVENKRCRYGIARCQHLALPNHRPRSKSQHHRIVAINAAPSVPVRCIEVDSPNHLYLCGEGWIPTHNTEAGNNWIGYVIHHAPGPMLAVQPTVEMAKRWSKQRIASLIESTPVLRDRVKEARARDSGNTVQSKEFPGGILVMTGANSAVGLRSMPVRYLFLDEVDAYDFDVGGEGDPVSLASQRTITFANRKIFLVSTPTIQGLSRIESEYEQSDKRRWWIPCPDCGEFQLIDEKRLQWEKGKPETAAYYCAHCGVAIPSHKKPWMNSHGAWRAESPGAGKAAGFHLSGLNSPWLTWAQIAERKIAAKDDAAMKVYVNTIEARTWTESGEAPEWQRLYDRREDYRLCTVPTGGLFLTAGVDVQDNRLEVEIVAWGRDRESWSIDYRVFQGRPSDQEVWDCLDQLLDERFTHASGVNLGIVRLAIDTGGHFTSNVYDWVRAKRSNRVLAIKGAFDIGAAIGIAKDKDVTVSGKRKKRGFIVWQVGTSFCKSELYGYLRKDRPTDEQLAAGEKFPAGFCHFPKYGEEFFKQLTAERLVTIKDARGFPHREWRQMRERNEALDCRVYARAAAAAKGIDRFNEAAWQELEQSLGHAAPAKPAEAANVQSPAPASTGRRVIRSSYL